MKKTMKTSRNLAFVLVLFTAISCNTSAKKEKMLVTNSISETSTNSKNEIMSVKTGAYLQITLKISDENRPAAAGVYLKYKEPFLNQIEGATSKYLIMRTEDVQVLHGFETEAQATAYLSNQLFSKDIVGELGPLLAADPEVRCYTIFQN